MELQYLLYRMSRTIVGSQTWYVDTSFDHVSHARHLMRLVVIWLLQYKDSMSHTINADHWEILVFPFGGIYHLLSSCVLEGLYI